VRRHPADRATGRQGQEALRGVADTSVLGDIAGAVPRLVRRTAQQFDLARAVVAHLPCLQRLATPAVPTGPLPAHDDPPIDVLRILAEPPAGDAGSPAGAAADSRAVGAPEIDDAPTAEAAGGPVPGQDELAIPDYDSLAASQVVPRLAALTAEELDEVGRYEAAHRGRRTILHRVDQLRRG
jgi:hypothetical protein